jgi:chemotaxis protein MotB
MFMRRRKGIEDDSEGGAPAWMTTFCDCMTLLLTFFVLLLTFSSFDEASLKRLEGAFQFRAKATPSVAESPDRIGDSMVPEERIAPDRTERGAEKPTLSIAEKIRHPKQTEEISETDAYHHERSLSISTRRVFLGQGAGLTRHGRERLEKIAHFLRLLPCKVIIGESRPGDSKDVGRSLERSWAVLHFFLNQGGLSPDRFSIATEGCASHERSGKQPVMQIVLLSKGVAE